jgi:hypothetical protein
MWRNTNIIKIMKRLERKWKLNKLRKNRNRSKITIHVNNKLNNIKKNNKVKKL